MLRNMPRPERRLTPEEADRFIGPNVTRMYSAIPPFTPAELNRLSTLPTSELGKRIIDNPTRSPWVNYELFARKDQESVPYLFKSARMGNAGAVPALARIGTLKSRQALVELAKIAEPSGNAGPAKAAAGVYLGVGGDKQGIEGMRLAVKKYPHWLHPSTTTQLVMWGDTRNEKLLAAYYRKGVHNPPVSLLRKLKTKESLNVLFSLPKQNYKHLEVISEIAEVNDPRVRSVMRQALLHREGRIRAKAAEWFTFKGTKSDLPALKHALAHPPVYANGVRNSKDHWTGPVKGAISAIEHRK